ncbi:PTS sugar transporter [Sphingobacterium spiritivorum]|uniref:Uncharacterized protein n=1 Tax=Sphingobacterium spiritivorum ATCC 33861 TaxID=525373 RepID=D7VR79_SPHSI|nr:hypothetical protein [Sphingobacterium spiritivorum]EFK56280.1 hypothetical protein HMPREF0766_13483 [Sphingobacterium spiritivorum ATCC 33861]QQT35631.1 PTS sugar transporter [Sphingobacterium spiritivorum]WQD32332.1 PTS sugar transporter [Sphingobacterium spiritivorum]SUJ08171.1 Uncharacterised protein [Sphingobacterium spiritivorum]
MKGIILSLFAILLFLEGSYAQQQNKDSNFAEFKRSFVLNFKYPSELDNKCIPTLTLMFIHFSTDGNVTAIKFSDSALPPFVNEMLRIKDKLDFKSIYKAVSNNNKENRNILIPIQIDADQKGDNGCLSIVNEESLKKLYLFQGQPISGNYYLYKTLYLIDPANSF